jgi:hypothetical protein
MPYIKQESRKQLDPAIEDLMIALLKRTVDGKNVTPSSGDFNYIISTLLGHWYEMTFLPSYDKVNTVVGILECVKQEYYRRVAVPYEDKKREAHGDVY